MIEFGCLGNASSSKSLPRKTRSRTRLRIRPHKVACGNLGDKSAATNITNGPFIQIVTLEHAQITNLLIFLNCRVPVAFSDQFDLSLSLLIFIVNFIYFKQTKFNSNKQRMRIKQIEEKQKNLSEKSLSSNNWLQNCLCCLMRCSRNRMGHRTHSRMP